MQLTVIHAQQLLHTMQQWCCHVEGEGELRNSEQVGEAAKDMNKAIQVVRTLHSEQTGEDIDIAAVERHQICERMIQLDHPIEIGRIQIWQSQRTSDVRDLNLLIAELEGNQGMHGGIPACEPLTIVFKRHLSQHKPEIVLSRLERMGTVARVFDMAVVNREIEILPGVTRHPTGEDSP